MGEIDKEKSIEQQAISVFKSERIEDIMAILLSGIVVLLMFLKILK